MIKPILWIVLGTIYGSYLGTAGNGIFRRSRCENCGRVLKYRELVPVLSFLFLRGRSRCCKTAIPVSYLFWEIGTGMLFFVVGEFFQFDLYSLWVSSFLGLLLKISLVDFKKQVIYDECLWVLLILRFLSWPWMPVTFRCLFVTLGIVFFFYPFVRLQKMGEGDLLLGAILGSFAKSPLQGIYFLLWACIFGGFYGAYLLIFKGQKGETMGFAPFLSLAAAVIFLGGFYGF